MWHVYWFGSGHSAADVHGHVAIGTQGPQHEPSIEGTWPVGQLGGSDRHNAFRVSQVVPPLDAPPVPPDAPPAPHEKTLIIPDGHGQQPKSRAGPPHTSTHVLLTKHSGGQSDEPPFPEPPGDPAFPRPPCVAPPAFGFLPPVPLDVEPEPLIAPPELLAAPPEPLAVPPVEPPSVCAPFVVPVVVSVPPQAFANPSRAAEHPAASALTMRDRDLFSCRMLRPL